MRVLLDENLDHGLRHPLGQYEVMTVAHMGWSGLKNGALLKVAEEHRIDVLLTGDQSLGHEQSVSGKSIAIVALSTILLPIIRENLPKIVIALEKAAPGSFQTVDCGTFNRKKNPGG